MKDCVNEFESYPNPQYGSASQEPEMEVKNIGENVVSKYKCDRCGYIEEVELEKGLLGVKKAERPATWGTDKDEKDLFCADCLKDYNEQYPAWYASFIAQGKKS